MTTTTITAAGVTATADQWSAAGYHVYRDSNDEHVDLKRYSGYSGSPYPGESDLMEARLATGASDWRVLAEVIRKRRESNERKTESTAIARLAEAIGQAAALDLRWRPDGRAECRDRQEGEKT